MMFLDILAIGFIILGLVIILNIIINRHNNANYVKLRNDDGGYAVLIPARDESKVIENLIISIEKQTFKINPKDVYIIVEDENDLTVTIAKKHSCSIIVRNNLEDRRRKGYALDDAIKSILEAKKKYQAYFIFDADNILDPYYFEKMSKSVNMGYDIGIGYRNTKNGNDSWVSSCSSLTFTMINTLGNSGKEKYTHTKTISGTGFYIRGYLIEKWQGFIFNSLTEDYELSLYAVLNNLTTTYNSEAIFFDEQPVSFKVSISQRVRWVKGYFEARKKYIPLIKKRLIKSDINYASKLSTYYGVRPIIYLILGIVFLFLKIIIKTFKTENIILMIKLMIVIFLGIYLLLLLLTYIMLKKDHNQLNLTKKNKIIALLMNPFFLSSYVYCAVVSIFKRNLKWEKIEHNQNIIK